MKIHKLTYSFFALTLLCSIVSCTAVELCPEASHPHVATVQAEFNWGNFNNQKPTQMNIVASRILNTWRAHGIAGTENNINDIVNGLSSPIIPDNNPESGNSEEENTDNTENTENQENVNTRTSTQPDEGDATVYPFRLKGGDYKAFAINTHDGLVLDNLECYLNQSAAKVDTLYLHMLETSRDDIKELQGLNLPDFNPTYRYIKNPGRIFYGINQNVSIRTGQTEVLQFDMKPVSQEVQVKFSIKKTGEQKDQINIEEVVAEMSGVCGRLNISSAYLDTTRLYRMVFSFDNLNVETQGDISTYSTTFYTMGIVPSPKDGLLVGQGILQLAVKASMPKPTDNTPDTQTEEENKEDNSRISRFFYAAGNPRKVLLDAQLIERREDEKTYLRYQDKPVIIELGTMLEINSQDILEHKDENTWEDQDKDDDLDIEM